MKLEVNGIAIDYRDEGTGLPVVFVHAYPLNKTMWDDQVAALEGRCRIITLDLRGFGQSSAPAGSFSIDDMAADVRALLSALSIDRAALIGLSMGGYVSLAFYRQYPGAVLGIVLADTRASADTPEGRERRMKAAEKAEAEGSAALAEDMIQALLAPSTVATRPDLVARVRAMMEGNKPQALAAAQRAMAGRPESTGLLSKMSFPAMVIVGGADALTPPAEAEAMASSIPGARFRVIDEAGHLSNVEAPAEFNNALTEFVGTLR
jgi:3-oxoadipate enol-lactonase